MAELIAFIDDLGPLSDGNAAWNMVFSVLATVAKGESFAVVSNQARNQISGFSINPPVDGFRANGLLGL